MGSTISRWFLGVGQPVQPQPVQNPTPEAIFDSFAGEQTIYVKTILQVHKSDILALVDYSCFTTRLPASLATLQSLRSLGSTPQSLRAFGKAAGCETERSESPIPESGEPQDFVNYVRNALTDIANPIFVSEAKHRVTCAALAREAMQIMLDRTPDADRTPELIAHINSLHDQTVDMFMEGYARVDSGMDEETAINEVVQLINTRI